MLQFAQKEPEVLHLKRLAGVRHLGVRRSAVLLAVLGVLFAALPLYWAYFRLGKLFQISAILLILLFVLAAVLALLYWLNPLGSDRYIEIHRQEHKIYVKERGLRHTKHYHLDLSQLQSLELEEPTPWKMRTVLKFKEGKSWVLDEGDPIVQQRQIPQLVKFLGMEAAS